MDLFTPVPHGIQTGDTVCRRWNSRERLKVVAIGKNIVIENEIGYFFTVSHEDLYSDFVRVS